MNKRIMTLAAMALVSLVTLAQPGRAGTLDDYYLEQFSETGAAARKSVSVSAADPTFRCGMPLKHDLHRDWNQLEPATQTLLAKQLAAPVLENEALQTSAAGHFLIHYATSGSDAPAPAPPETVTGWITKVAASFESAYAAYQSQGYRAPPAAPYNVYLRNLAALRIYGQTTTSAPAPSAGFPNAFSSFIEIDKDFTNDIYTKASINNGVPVFTPLDSLNITSAHEFHHVIQFAYNVFFDVWYAEATSTWYEAELYPAVRQNYGYVPAWFANSTRRLDLAVDANALATGAGYGRWIFNRYLAEQHTTDIIRTFWQNLAPLPSPNGSSDIPMLPVINSSLAGGLAPDFLGFARRVYLQQEWSQPFDRTAVHLRYVPASPAYSSFPVNRFSLPLPKATLEQLSFAYFRFVPANAPGSSLTIHVNGTPAIVARAFRKDSITQAVTEFNISNIYPASVTVPNVNTASEVVLLLANTSGDTIQNANFSTDGTLLNTDPVTTAAPPAAATATGGGGGGGGGCFIATAAYGSYLHPQVQTLRHFRDTYLLTNAPGRAFVELYYRLSPPVAAVIAQNAPFRLLVRLLLTPLVLAAAHPLAAGVLLLAALCSGVCRLRSGRSAKPVHQDHAV